MKKSVEHWYLLQSKVCVSLDVFRCSVSEGTLSSAFLFLSCWLIRFLFQHGVPLRVTPCCVHCQRAKTAHDDEQNHSMIRSCLSYSQWSFSLWMNFIRRANTGKQPLHIIDNKNQRTLGNMWSGREITITRNMATHLPFWRGTNYTVTASAET